MNTSRFNENIDADIKLKTVNFLEVIVTCYIAPYISIFGLLSNIMIILILPSKSIQINSISRMFYLAIAIGDIGNLIFWHIREFFTKGLSILSSGEIYLNIYSDPICKLLLSLDYLFFPLSQYGLLAFSIERVLALYFPLKHKLFMTPKKAVLLRVGCVGPIWIILTPISILLGSKLQGDIPYCGANPTHPLYSIYSVCFLLFIVALHPLLTAACDAAIILKIWKRKSELQKLASSYPIMKANEMRTILLLLILSFINLIVFTPNVLTWAGVFVTRKFSETEKERQLWQSLAEVTSSLTAIAHSVNFVVYIIMIPSFRRAIFCRRRASVERPRVLAVYRRIARNEISMEPVGAVRRTTLLQGRVSTVSWRRGFSSEKF